MRDAEQDADVALSQASRSEALSRPPRLACSIGTERFSLLAGLPGLAHFFGQSGIEDGHYLYIPYLVHADLEVQREPWLPLDPAAC